MRSKDWQRRAVAGQALVLDARFAALAMVCEYCAALPQARLQWSEWSWPLAIAASALRCSPGHACAAWRYLAGRLERLSAGLSVPAARKHGRAAAVKAATEMQPGSWLVSLDFQLPGQEATACLQGNSRL